MDLKRFPDSRSMGRAAAQQTAQLLGQAIAQRGVARLLVSTGASQFDLLDALVLESVNWKQVEMFHLDEYIGLPETHPASFRRYLKERLTTRVEFRAVHFVDGDHPEAALAELSAAVSAQPIDVGLIGIGVNAHIAFNDPPADFDTQEPYKIVILDDTCRRQQVGEGWFATVDEVPVSALSMTVQQILKCRSVISFVPHAVKAQAIHDTLRRPVTNLVPATKLKEHLDWTLYVDQDSGRLA